MSNQNPRNTEFTTWIDLNNREGVDEEEEQGEQEQEDEILERIREFELKPHDVKDYLDRYVIGQDDAKKVIAVAVCDHYNHVRQCLEDPEIDEEDYAKQNVLLLGPTGVGKTYLIRCVSKLIGVPFAKADATKFSGTGYVGQDTEDLVRDLVKAADDNVKLAQFGMIYVDEIDKIASGLGHGMRDVSGRDVQTNLLKLMEETEVSAFSQTDILGQMEMAMKMMQQQRGDEEVDPMPQTINTKNILIITSGAFAGLNHEISKRMTDSTMGFTNGGKLDMDNDLAEGLKYATTQDLVDFGFEPEFVGRMPVRVACDELSEDDLYHILTESEGSILRQYEHAFRGYGIELTCEDDALHRIAALAKEEKTGARGLMTVLERVFRQFKYELPSTEIKRLNADVDVVDEPEASLNAMILQHQKDK